MRDFEQLFASICDALQHEKRISYRALRRRFELSDDDLEDMKDELIHAKRWAEDEANRVLVWLGQSGEVSPSTSQPDHPEPPPVVEATQPAQLETLASESSIPDRAERRQLTVMFCDLVGSTSLSGAFDPEDLRDIIRDYQSTCTEVVQRFEGHVAQHLGDGLLIYFGYPLAHEDDAQRAVRTGLGMIGALQTLNPRLKQKHGIEIAVRIGVHTGLTVIGDIGAGAKQEQLALGETPNIAARIEGIAEPNHVVISADTHRLVEGYFDCQVAGEYSLKGVAQPVTAYRVLRESRTQSRLDVTAPRELTPLVGRDSEMSLLFDRWEQATSGHGQVVLLSGEAGIGKSRLIRALRDRVSTESQNRLECRCSPYFQNTTLYPLIDLIERTFGLDQQEAPETKLRKLEAALSQFRQDIKTTLPLLAFPLSIPLPEDRYPPLKLTPQHRKEKALETFISLLLEVAERDSVLFIMEDLHWVDATTIELLHLLIEQIPTAPILAVLTCRPEFLPPWGLKSHLTPIALNRLPRHQIEMMVERVTDNKRLPEEVIQHLIEKTDGVPLYVEEMTKALLESGHLKEGDRGYELTAPLSTLAIPATLQDSLMARLDKLGTAKGVAQIGATIGRQFSYDLLQAVSPLSEASLQDELEKLIDAELIYQRGIAPNPTYMFKHALIQDAAYESLMRSTRQEYHRRIAEALEEQFPETIEAQYELVAYHFTEAGIHEKSVVYWYRAGHHEMQRFAYQEGISNLTNGLKSLKHIPETEYKNEQELNIQLLLGPALAANKGNASPEAEKCYLRSRELLQQIGDPNQLLRILIGLRTSYHVRGAFQKARDMGEQAVALVHEIEDPALVSYAYYVLGHTLFSLGEFVKAQTNFEKGAAQYSPKDHRSDAYAYRVHPGVFNLFTLAWSLWYLGYPDRSKAYAITSPR